MTPDEARIFNAIITQPTIQRLIIALYGDLARTQAEVEVLRGFMTAGLTAEQRELIEVAVHKRREELLKEKANTFKAATMIDDAMQGFPAQAAGGVEVK